MAADREFSLMAGRPRSLAERTRQLISAVFEVKVRRAYKAVFLDPQGELSANGALVLADMAKAAGVGKVLAAATDADLRDRHGRRAELLHVLARLDGVSLKRAADRLTKLQTKVPHEGDQE